MVNVTVRAREELKRLLYANVDMSQARLRLIDRGQGNLGFGIDIELPGDESVEHDGSTVLIINPELARNLNEITIDVDDTPEGSELVICHKPEEIGRN